MRALLKDGKLIPPASLIEGIKRRLLLADECHKITKQLNDQSRQVSGVYATLAIYTEWRDRASKALRVFRREGELLDEWIKNRENGEELLLDAWKLLRTLEEDDMDLSPDEKEVIRKLDAYFNKEPNAA